MSKAPDIPRSDQPRGQPRDPLIGTQTLFKRRFGRGKGGRVTNHQIEHRALRSKRLHDLERIALTGLEPLLDRHALRALAGQFERRGGTVDR